MRGTSDLRLTMVWLFLVAITIVSWLTGSSNSIPLQVNTAVTTIVLMISALKARFILREFMEVNHGSRALKTIADAWVSFSFLLLIGFYIFGAHFWKWIGNYFLHD